MKIEQRPESPDKDHLRRDVILQILIVLLSSNVSHPMSDYTCLYSKYKNWVNRFAVQCPGLSLSSLVPTVALFFDSSIQNVHQVNKACYILSECLCLYFDI
jgi:hypothetical protein